MSFPFKPRTACVVLIALALPACASEPSRADQPPSTPKLAEAEADPVIAELYEAHNHERAEADLPPLKPSSKLETAARVHARDMADREEMSHEGSDKSTPAQRIERQGDKGRATGENVAFGHPTAEAVMHSWMHSPHHKKNILGNFEEIGAARATARDGTPYWCVDFGLPWPNLDPDRAIPALIEALNRERAKADLPPLKRNPKLEDVARRQARFLADHHTVSPKDAGPSPFDQIDRSGYPFREVGATFADGPPTAEDAARLWLDAPSQRKTILGKFVDVGAGCAADPDGKPYWCLILALPR